MNNTGSSYNSISGTFNSAKGELRLVNVSAGRGGKSYIAWQKVPARLNDFCIWVNQQRKNMDTMSIEEKYKFSFETHYRLVTIHPWADGNGRMSRLVMNMLQCEMGIPMSVVKKESRLGYINSLSQSQEDEDSSLFLNFMLKHHQDNIMQQIEEYRASIRRE